MGYQIVETMTPSLRNQILALHADIIVRIEILKNTRIQEEGGMPAFGKIQYLMRKAKQRQGDGDPLDCQRFRSEIGGALWDSTLPSKYDNAQKALLEWWMECEGVLERFEVLPQRVIKSI